MLDASLGDRYRLLAARLYCLVAEEGGTRLLEGGFREVAALGGGDFFVPQFLCAVKIERLLRDIGGIALNLVGRLRDLAAQPQAVVLGPVRGTRRSRPAGGSSHHPGAPAGLLPPPTGP